MNEDAGQIVSLLTQIRDDQREQLALQKVTAFRHKRMSRVYYVVIAITLPLLVYFAYQSFHH